MNEIHFLVDFFLQILFVRVYVCTLLVYVSYNVFDRFILCNNITRIQTFAQQFSVLVEETEKRINWFRVQHNKNVDFLSKTVESTSTASQSIKEYSEGGDEFLRANTDRLKEVGYSSPSNEGVIL